MGFRFRRSVRPLPGVRLNFSKSGISTSLGGRGATINLGKRGARTTVGLPGTGISYSQQLGGASGGSGEGPSPSRGRSRSGCLWLFLAGIGLAGLSTLFSANPPPAAPTASPQAPAANMGPLDPESHARPSNRYSQQMFDMDPGKRLATFQALLTTSGEKCSAANEAVLKGSLKHKDDWRVTCVDTGDWMIEVSPDSSTRLLNCQAMTAMGMDLSCRKPWPTARNHRHRHSQGSG